MKRFGAAITLEETTIGKDGMKGANGAVVERWLGGSRKDQELNVGVLVLSERGGFW